MNEPKKYFQFGLTKTFPCNYLMTEKERLIVVTNVEELTSENYERLLMSGFRRSGEQVYRPHCENCNSCESIRLPVNEFSPSKSQKRISAINKDLTARVVKTPRPEYFSLYQRYIDNVHKDGAMYPANFEQYENFIFSSRVDQLFLELYLEEELISVAVCDNLPSALSALYTFFDPNLSKRSLGKFSILKQIELSKKMHKKFLYLGYQIDECAKMNYKNQYFPHERLKDDNWQRTTNKQNLPSDLQKHPNK
ncbi:arginyltransferase [Thalassotalea psychrophila]|uniref:Aspartate/glutamate leucyltransferase n=1 Tax=Thalassotalea psychrophila TaxID=3065647 RepID=A0ABY9TP09_9GAMM|nr:arginyltransferase [Colwelliaceae bacterium SQ149]